MKKILGIIVVGLMLSGCFATESKYIKILDTWMGKTENHLVDKWGPPDGAYTKDDGSKILTYQQSGSYNLPGVQVIDSMTGFPVNTSGPTVATSCRTRFNISSSGKITSGSWQGNSCIATNPDSKLKLPW